VARARNRGMGGGLMSAEQQLAALAAEIVLPRPEQAETATAEAERRLSAFVPLAWPSLFPDRPFVNGWHVGCICEHLQALTELQIQNLIINAPPRHTKSLLCCVFWFCWAWLRAPGSQWIYCTYGENLAHRDANFARELIGSGWYQHRWGEVFHLKRSQDAAERYVNDRGGHRISTTVGGKAMGEGADYLVMDDPHKPNEVRSEAARRAVIEAWTRILVTRGNNPATTRKLLSMQRLHERDLTGYLLAERGNYEHLVLPAEHEPQRYWFLGARGDDGAELARPRHPITPTSLQRARPELQDPRAEEGEPLWPQQWPTAALESLKADLELGVPGQLQQRPSPAQGALFREEMFRHFSVEEEHGRRVVQLGFSSPANPEPPLIPLEQFRFFQTADTALTAGQQSAFTAVLTFAWHRGTRTLLVWDCWRRKLLVHEQLPALKQLRKGKGLWDPRARAWAVPGHANPWPRPILRQGVERKASGYGILQEALLEGIPMVALKDMGKDKITRAAPAVNWYGSGRVWHAAGTGWVSELEDELLGFPSGAYADQVDCVAYGVRMAQSDAVLNAEIHGELTWLPSPKVNGRPATVDDLRKDDRVETLTVGGVEVEFDDRDPVWER
jgi:predicted phage terminase large subunit-like protein